MKHIVVDLEMNPVNKFFKKEREIFRTETIEIGAVVLDDNYKEIGSFMTYVKPRFNHEINHKITKLTGITYDLVENAPEFETAFHMFVDFCESYQEEYEIIAWSDSDQRQFVKEAEQKGYLFSEKETKFMSQWYDFQLEFGKILGLKDQISLKNALMYAGEDFVGREHDALYDARNTAELFAITRVEEKTKKALAKVIDALTPQKKTAQLGELIDFTSLLEAVNC